MEVEIDKQSGIVSIIPKKLNKSGNDLEISFCDDFVCFTVKNLEMENNCQISYDEFERIREFKIRRK